MIRFAILLSILIGLTTCSVVEPESKPEPEIDSFPIPLCVEAEIFCGPTIVS